jgi:hypothetical protein
MTPAAAVRDAKAGWCSTCRRGSHALCAAPRCECHRMGEDHPNRPEPGARPIKAAPAPAPAAKARAPRTEPVWELVKADPPAPPPKAAKPKKLTPAERAQPFLEAIVEDGDLDWHRIALFGTPHAAGRIKAALATEFAEGWEWKSARDDQGRPAVFVRWVTGRKES